MPLHRTDRLLLFGLVAVNLVLKLSWLDVTELAHDEPFTVFWSQRPWAELWAMFRTENNPPLYFLLIKAWSAVARRAVMSMSARAASKPGSISTNCRTNAATYS